MWVAQDLRVIIIKLCQDISQSILKAGLKTGIQMAFSTSSEGPPLQDLLLWTSHCQRILMHVSFILVEALFFGGVLRIFFLLQKWHSCHIVSLRRCKRKGQSPRFVLVGFGTRGVHRLSISLHNIELWKLGAVFNWLFDTFNTCKAATKLSLRTKSLISSYQFTNFLFNLPVIQFSHCWHWRKFEHADSLTY